jgi:hypothetical protein
VGGETAQAPFESLEGPALTPGFSFSRDALPSPREVCSEKPTLLPQSGFFSDRGWFAMRLIVHRRGPVTDLPEPLPFWRQLLDRLRLGAWSHSGRSGIAVDGGRRGPALQASAISAGRDLFEPARLPEPHHGWLIARRLSIVLSRPIVAYGFMLNLGGVGGGCYDS